jgi:hypothetical protein
MIDIASRATNGVKIPGRKATRAEIMQTFKMLDFRISTYGLFTILHNTIIVDFPRHLVVTHSLLPIHSFGPFCAAPSNFQQVMSSR